ncbi:HAD family hydrolase [Marinactinospora thermotolerans]|uniref:Putative hydrolase of the HAD superfamily n=1 Tax=Marinactinospora thermotolerans DSM 45154 TaxID=1122192 RepID=A0A1T4PWD6_9ACTN|nr:HAD family hydrolase [Marinactinospora thermotolerans]SJZ95884.1 putative hydrolase of the HAD superfamily [Marinactinospora thermotolerans DSM 45154]
MPAPTTLFFDLDDTLLDDHAASSAGLRTLMDRLGHPDYNAARRLWDIQTHISFSAYVAGRISLTQQRRERIRALATHAGHPWISDEHSDDLYHSYLDSHRAAWRAFPDVVPTLNRLTAAGITLGVITNGPEAMQRDKLAALDITHYFKIIVCADTAGAGKPDPRIFHTACHHLGVTPDRCWHIGDQLKADAIGALAAGIRPILLDRHRLHPGQADITTITTLDDLPRLLGPAVSASTGLL